MSKLPSDPVTVCHLGLGAALPADAADGLHWEAVDTLDALSARLRLRNLPAIVIGCPTRQQVHSLLSWSGMSQAAASSAVVVAWPSPDRELSRRLIQTGVQDVIALEDAQGARLKRTVFQAVDRKAQDLEVRRAWSIDLGTGLPNRALLIELLNQLCALREREPAPMALLVFRLDGLDAIEARLGGHAAQLLKRKAAVRLRAGLRSSDVVAVVGSDAFAAVLPSMERPQDGERVASKLAQSMAEPYVVTGQQAVLGVGTGVSLFPDHGRQAEELLRLAYAAAVQTRGARRGGLVGGIGDAANDE